MFQSMPLSGSPYGLGRSLVSSLPLTPSGRGSSYPTSPPLLQTEKREWDSRMRRLQREADRLRATLWSHGINPAPIVEGSNSTHNTANLAANASQSLAPNGSHRGSKNGHGRRRGNKQHHLDMHRQMKKLVPLSCRRRGGGGGGGSSFGDGNNSSTASAAVIGFRHRVGELDGPAPLGWRHS